MLSGLSRAYRFVKRGRAEFNQTGWLAHRPGLDAEVRLVETADLSGRTYLVTGAASGVGYELTRYLLSKGAFVYVMIRGDAAREAAFVQRVVGDVAAEAAAPGDDVRSRVHVLLGDCGTKRGVRDAWAAFREHQARRRQVACDADVKTSAAPQENAPVQRAAPLDAVVCNAGALLDEIAYTAEGMEVTLATHLVFGSHFLAKLALGGGGTAAQDTAQRVVFVSSGGMLNAEHMRWDAIPVFNDAAKARLAAREPTEDVAAGSPLRYFQKAKETDFASLAARQASMTNAFEDSTFTASPGGYNGQMQYAYAKRAQVLLAEALAAAHPGKQIVSCHPGWTATPGVDKAYGSAMKLLLNPLRTTAEGTLGMKWLLVCPPAALRSGDFYLDCRPDLKYLSPPSCCGEAAADAGAGYEAEYLRAQMDILEAAVDA